ncbi:hypothetical protein bcgnr5371_27690 [Bacillus cereus]|nr:hypothetical protein [Bacillus sp. p3-SID196]MCT1383709.1 hypothetical protein [Bacillus sp. p3-SID196]
MKDSVKEFLTNFKITEEDILKFAKESSIFVEYDKGKLSWDSIIDTILDGELIYVRSYGNNKDSKNLTQPQEIIKDFYKHYFGVNSICLDPDNNKIPHQWMERWTGFKKNQSIVNYKLSHIWEKNLNPYAFNAPWNLVFTSIFIDPFTGHESSGNLRNKVKGFIKGQALNVYENEIIQFNNIMDEKNHLLEEFLEFDFIKKYDISKKQDAALRRSLIR